ncbi:hypothetical protein JCGZ_14001 [Jatropha curcas]|uniref:Uncharacterized protein n=1 Tax=Jatropha curcas TaxID=180498 RepID=A0A067K7L0_JATCU|nr:eukaryotic translation initiation factor 4B2 [Jatropha curcas]KDP28230.1 hypothetical protein JCGZ_14001 [Jatropha curcas]
MVESESRLDRQVHSSWADEVEKEEEEVAQAQAQLQQKQKPNPFGSARPREIVLQEKGIDWRKLDLHLQQKSPLRQEAPNEKSRKENIPDANLEFNLLAARNKMPLFVPPLRFPPKNMIAYNLYGFDNGQQDFHRRSNLKPNGIQRSQSHEQRLQQLKKNGSKVESAQSVGKGGNLQNPRRKFNGNGQHLPSNAKDWKNIKDGFALGEGAKERLPSNQSCSRSRKN